MNAGENQNQLSIDQRTRGRAVWVADDGTLYVGRCGSILQSVDQGRTFHTVARIPCSLKLRLATFSRLATRLLRHEVRAMVRLSDGTIVAVNRQGIYRQAPGESRMTPVQIADDGVPARPPTCISLGPDDTIVWGEYFSNPERRAVRVFVSTDGGRQFEVAYTFPPGAIRHVHNCIARADGSGWWLASGDFDTEPGIGVFSDDFSDFEWIVRGSQLFRVVWLFDRGDHLLYGTDTELEPNAIVRLDLESRHAERLKALPGSCIYGGRFGNCLAVSTTVEPSTVNTDRSATLWVSTDGERWSEVFAAPIDRWGGKYFQYGSIILPRNESRSDTLMFSGQALRGFDDQVIVGRLAGSKPDRAGGAPS